LRLVRQRPYTSARAVSRVPGDTGHASPAGAGDQQIHSRRFRLAALATVGGEFGFDRHQRREQQPLRHQAVNVHALHGQVTDAFRMRAIGVRVNVTVLQLQLAPRTTRPLKSPTSSGTLLAGGAPKHRSCGR